MNRRFTLMVHNISSSAMVVAAGEIVASDFGDDLVLLNLGDGVYYGLEQVGVRIWQLVQNPVSVAELLDAIQAEYDVEPDRCEREIVGMLSELAGHGLVEIREG